MFEKYSFRMKLVKDGTEQEVNVGEEIKSHFERNKRTYIIGGAVLAGITCLVMRGHAFQHIGRGIPVAAKGGIPVLGENVVNVRPLSLFSNRMTNHIVSVIESGRQGPPSWVIRCKETGEIFTSQAGAAREMDLPANEISRQLNGLIDHVRDFHFERICLAA
jgi:hypothetical protein